MISDRITKDGKQGNGEKVDLAAHRMTKMIGNNIKYVMKLN